MKYAIGLNIGIASGGYAVVALDHEENPWGIIKMGSRIFDVAENPKDGASLALPRREARSTRRRLRRHKHRLERIRNLLVTHKLLTSEILEHLYDGTLSDIYSLRVQALDDKVSNEDVARILINLAQRRGFKSNRKADAADKEAGLLLTAIKKNSNRIQEHHYRTVGEMLYKDDTFAQYKRNKSGCYLATVQRDWIENEAKQIIDKQYALGNTILNQEFKDAYLDILLGQRNFDEGPGDPSPYAGNQIEKMIGKCTFEKEELRAAKATYSFEYFNLLQKVNHLRLIIKGKTISLDEMQRQKIIRMAHQKPDLNYYHIRKELGLDDKVLFNNITYSDNEFEKTEKKTKFNYLKIYHQVRKVLDSINKGYIDSLSIEQLDEIGRILSTYKGDAKRTEELSRQKFNKEEIDLLLGINGIAKFAHLSLKALRKINPFLEQGLTYDKACLEAGYQFCGHDGNKKTFSLPAYSEEMENITSPVVRRAVAQTIKVVNAIIREQNASPTYLNIELAREMAKNFTERKQLEKSMKENQANNEQLMEKMRVDFHKSNPTGLDLVKLKLWEQQDGISPYSQKSIDVNRLFEPGYVDIDHIIPYSISFDDTLKNKVLVMSSENREKSNMLPLQYLAKIHGQSAADKFTVWVKNNIRDYKKRLNLLKEKLSEEDLNGFKERNLQDTKTMSRFLYNYINDHLLFAPSDTGRKRKVTAVNGAVTSYLRKRWGINKVRADGDKHHAVDALVIACTTNKMIKDISSYSEYREMEYSHTDKESILANPHTGEIIARFPYPWDDFRAELAARLADNPAAALQKQQLFFYRTMDLNNIKPIFVSRMPRRKVTGAAHKATIKSAKHATEGLAVCKVDLTSLKLNKDGEIDNYYAPESDTLLYNALKARLKQYNNNAGKAFKEDFYKPKADGTPGPLVKKVKVYEKTTLNVAVQQTTGIADNDSMVRVDVFHIENDGYYLVPIYVADTLKKELPNKAIVAHKNYEDWKEMDDKNFIFSLYPNDLIKFTHKKEVKFSKVNKKSDLPDEYFIKESFVYYKGTDISAAAITVISHDNAYIVRGLGVKRLSKLEKYQVDVLGNYTLVKKEPRQRFL